MLAISQRNIDENFFRDTNIPKFNKKFEDILLNVWLTLFLTIGCNDFLPLIFSEKATYFLVVNIDEEGVHETITSVQNLKLVSIMHAMKMSVNSAKLTLHVLTLIHIYIKHLPLFSLILASTSFLPPVFCKLYWIAAKILRYPCRHC